MTLLGTRDKTSHWWQKTWRESEREKEKVESIISQVEYFEKRVQNVAAAKIFAYGKKPKRWCAYMKSK